MPYGARASIMSTTSARVLIAIIMTSLLVAPLWGQESSGEGALSLRPKDMGTSELLSYTSERLDGGHYSDAVPALEEIILRLKNIDDEEAKSTVDFATFSLGQCYFFQERYDDARRQLEVYIRDFPKGESRIAALFYLAETYVVENKWSDVERTAIDLLKESALAKDQNLLAHQLLGEALYRLEKWEACVKPMRYVFNQDANRKASDVAAVILVTAMVKLEQYDELFQFIPALSRGGARYNVALNAALMEGGRINLDKNELTKALILYRLVFLKKELKTHLEERIAQLEQLKGATFRPGIDNRRGFLRRRREIGGEIAETREQLNVIESVDDYDLDITMQIADIYMRMERFWEAYLMFQSFYDLFPGTPHADDGLYMGFGALMRMKQMDRAIKQGNRYLETFPEGAHRADVYMLIAQEYMDREQLDKVKETVEKGLADVHLDREAKGRLHYLQGFISFKNQDIDSAFYHFDKVVELDEGADITPPARYWSAMCHLFNGHYRKAEEAFDQYLDKYPDGSFAEDALYRSGVSMYGLGRVEEARSVFERFVERYPGSMLLSEVQSLSADIAASKGALDEAEVLYSEALESASTQGQADYAVFRHAEMMELEDRYDEIIELMNRYLTVYGDLGNYAEAHYWIGKAHKARGDMEQCLDTYLNVIVDYGKDKNAVGVDLIVNEIMTEREVLVLQDPEVWDQFLRRLGQLAQRPSGDKTLDLRLKTFWADLSGPEAVREVVPDVVSEAHIVDAAPSTLGFMAREAVRRQQFDLVESIYQHFLEHFEESDLIVDVVKAESERLLAEGLIEAARVLIDDQVLSRFGYDPDLGWAQKRYADTYRLSGDYEKALEEYKMMFSVKAWKGPLTAEALYWMGECFIQLGELQKGFGFLQRIYVLYGDPEWVAKAYMRSAQVLALLQDREATDRKQEIVNTYRDMLDNPVIVGRPELKEAQIALQELVGSENVNEETR